MSDIYVRLSRPEGYENVHPDLVVEDAQIDPAFAPLVVTDEIERLRAELSGQRDGEAQEIVTLRHKLAVWGCADHREHDEDTCPLCCAEIALAEARADWEEASDEIERLRRELHRAERERDEVRARLDRADCTHREGGDTRHCRHDRLCWHCRHDEAVALLKELEWGGEYRTSESTDWEQDCPVCDQRKRDGHAPGCRLDALLGGRDE